MTKLSARPKASIHPTALVERGAEIGAGSRVWQFTVVKKGARIGRDCNLGAHCYVERGATVGDGATVKNDVALWEGVALEDGVFVGPNAVFTNDVHPRSPRLPEAAARYETLSAVLKTTLVKRGATLGAGAMILAGTTIGRFATVGMGAVVLRDVPDHALTVGSPARRVGWSCACGLPLPARLLCRGCGRRYRRAADGLSEAA